MADLAVKDIVTTWLKSNGYDGLYLEQECGCLIAGNRGIAPCCDDMSNCKPGYRSECDGTCDTGSCNFHVSSEKGKAIKEQKILLAVRPDSIQYELTKGKDWFGLYLRDLERYCNYLEEK